MTTERFEDQMIEMSTSDFNPELEALLKEWHRMIHSNEELRSLLMRLNEQRGLLAAAALARMELIMPAHVLNGTDTEASGDTLVVAKGIPYMHERAIADLKEPRIIGTGQSS